MIYEVEAEEIFSAEASPAPQVSVAAVQPMRVGSDPVRPSATIVEEEGFTVIESPLPGSVLDVKVTEGGHVDIGQVLIILEAMKMENEVTSPVRGHISSIKVKKGSAVDANDILLIIETDRA
jgi:biotin carboxyl carrier protein